MSKINTSDFTSLKIEIWENINTGEIEVYTNTNNYGACHDWVLVARQIISFMGNDGLSGPESDFLPKNYENFKSKEIL